MSGSSAKRPMNVLYLHSHDTGRYVSPYGYAVPTPHIQALAESGTVFRRAFAAAPTCSPSRAALLTGQWAHMTGMLGLAHRGFRLNEPEQHIAAVLRDAGYTRVLSGMQHVGVDVVDRVYDRNLAQPDTSVAVVAPRAVEEIGRLAAEGRPFFLDAGFFETHRDFPDPGADDDPRYVAPPLAQPDTPETRADMAAFHTSVRELDRGIGMILDALETHGLADDTLVIQTTDHGLAFPRMKCTLTAHGIGVLLVLRAPGVIPAGRVVDAMVSHVDVFPTICDLLGLASPGWLQGRSLLPLLDGSAAAVRTETFAEVTYHAAYEPQRSVRTDRWAYIRRYGNRPTPVLPNIDDGPTRDLWLEAGWDREALPSEQLYDLVFDPGEANNLATSPRHTAVLADLRDRLDRWMRETDDPLLRGDVPLPPGATTNDVDDRSATGSLWRAGDDGRVERISDPAVSP
ncbi:MAG TPA: sulfatase [Thermomicrobiales bacterium]|nr:sulfatase [Thermomicrobiales bacterium]